MERVLLQSSTPPKINSLLHAHVYPHVSRAFRVLAKFKSLVLEAVQKKGASRARYSLNQRKKKRSTKNKLTNFIKLHFSWVSTHIMPASEPQEVSGFNVNRGYYDTTWSVVVPVEVDGEEDTECCYLSWLEENSDAPPEDDGMCEIDRLAEKFIARCHEMFLLEKQESYRRYQEMMARSI